MIVITTVENEEKKQPVRKEKGLNNPFSLFKFSSSSHHHNCSAHNKMKNNQPVCKEKKDWRTLFSFLNLHRHHHSCIKLYTAVLRSNLPNVLIKRAQYRYGNSYKIFWWVYFVFVFLYVFCICIYVFSDLQIYQMYS